MSVGDDRHDDQRGEEAVRDDAALEADVDDDQLHQAARIHQRADAERFAIRNAVARAASQQATPLPSTAATSTAPHISQRKPELSRPIFVFRPE